jgi:hypothetical protein
MKYNQFPLLKSYLLDRFFLRAMFKPIHVFTLTDNFSKFHLNQSTNEGAIHFKHDNTGPVYSTTDLRELSTVDFKLGQLADSIQHKQFYHIRIIADLVEGR